MVAREALSREHAVRHVLAKQHLAPGTAATDLIQVTDRLVGLHGTSPTTPHLSLLARLQSFTKAELDRALYTDRSLIRVKAMRGTVFLFTRALAPIAYAATRSVTLNGDRRWLSANEALYNDLAPKVRDALAGQSLTLSEIRRVLGAEGDLAGVISLMCDAGVLARDRPSGSWRSSTFFRYRMWHEVLPDVELARHNEAEALPLLVHDYLNAYGPATLTDIAWWTGLSMARIRAAVQQLGDGIVPVTVSGLTGQFLMTREDLSRLHEAPPANVATITLLPELDPLTMGYKERDRYLDPRYRDLVFDRGGNATSTILVNGIVVGVWDVTEQPQPAVRVLLFHRDQPERDVILTRAVAAGAFWFDAPVPLDEYRAMVPLTQRTGVMRKPLDGADPIE